MSGGCCCGGRQHLLAAGARPAGRRQRGPRLGPSPVLPSGAEGLRPAPGYSPSPASAAEVSSPDGPGRQRGGGGARGPRWRGGPGAPPRAGAAPGSRALCAPASARRRGGQAGRRAPWLALQGPQAAAAALPAPARPLPGRGGAENRGSAGDGGCAARETRGGHGHLPGAPAFPPAPRPPGKGNSGRAEAMEKNGPASCTRPRRAPVAAAGTAQPESSRVPPDWNFKAAGRWKRRGAALPPRCPYAEARHARPRPRGAPARRGPGPPGPAARAAGTPCPSGTAGGTGRRGRRKGNKGKNKK